MADIAELTTKELTKAMSAGELSVPEVAQFYLDQIERHDSSLNAYLEVYDDVKEQASSLESKRDEFIEAGAPLFGVPVAVKDNILVRGREVTAASKILEGYRATYDATVIKKLKEAGALFLGRTNMDEFAMGTSTEGSAYAVTKNPFDKNRVPGGSSGGSAAAVGGGIAPVALGSDTAGSVRQPSAFCGTVGLKPTYGSVSRYGLIALGSSLDVIGPIGRTVEDVELLFNVIRGGDPLDSTSFSLPASDKKQEAERGDPLVVGVPTFVREAEGIDPDTLEVFEKNLKELQSLGYEVREIELPHMKYSVPAYYILLPAEASSNLARFDGVKYGPRVSSDDLLKEYLKTRSLFGPEPRRRILIGTYVLSAGYADQYYYRAQKVRSIIRKEFVEAFENVDVIATPTTAGPAFKVGEKIDDPVKLYVEDIFTGPANMAGIPAISIPSGTVERENKDLPVGIQFMARHGREDDLFGIGRRFEKERS